MSFFRPDLGQNRPWNGLAALCAVFTVYAVVFAVLAIMMAPPAAAEDQDPEWPEDWVSFVHPRAGFSLFRPQDLIEAPGENWNESDAFRLVTWRFPDAQGEISVHAHHGPGRLALEDWVKKQGGEVRVESPNEPFIMARSVLEDGVLMVVAYVQVPTKELILEFRLEIPNVENWRERGLADVVEEYVDRVETFWQVMETLRIPPSVPDPKASPKPEETVKQPAE